MTLHAIVFVLYILLGSVKVLVAGGRGNSSNILHAFHERMSERHRNSKTHSSFVRIHEQYGYEECNSSYIVKDYGPNKAKRVRFLHIPKTGTTLGATFTHYCCAVDGVFVDVLRQFNSIIPPEVITKVCDPVCFGTQPRSHNGDPWSHIPHRHPLDSGAAIAMFRQPEARLASQLAYMQVLGTFSSAFGFRRLDISILYHLISFYYDSALTHNMNLLIHPQSHIGQTLTELRESPYGLSANNTKERVLSFSDAKFLSMATNCVNLQTTLNVPAYTTATAAQYNLSHSVNGFYTRLEQHFHGNATAIEEFQLCGLRAAVHYPGILGCQTRMILGRSCFDTYKLTEDDVREAKRRLSEDFLFVGKGNLWIIQFFCGVFRSIFMIHCGVCVYRHNRAVEHERDPLPHPLRRCAP